MSDGEMFRKRVRQARDEFADRKEREMTLQVKFMELVVGAMTTLLQTITTEAEKTRRHTAELTTSQHAHELAMQQSQFSHELAKLEIEHKHNMEERKAS